MASTELKHRRPDDSKPSSAAADGGATTTTTTNGAHNKAMAKRGLKSLALAITIPLSLTFSIFLLTNPQHHDYPPSSKPFWVPSTRVVNVGSLGSSLLMGVSAWLVWAEGGFHARPNTLYLYVVYSVLCLAWYALTLGAGARRLGLVACLGKTTALVGCDRLFRGVSRTAADLVKPCLAWSVFLTVVNLAMLSL